MNFNFRVGPVVPVLALFLLGWNSPVEAQTPTPDIRVSFRQAGAVVLNLTPTPVGNSVSRNEIILHNDADGASAMYCGYNLATLSKTPGPLSGNKLSPGEGETICRFSDKILYCFSDGTTAYFDEARMVTPTPTP